MESRRSLLVALSDAVIIHVPVIDCFLPANFLVPVSFQTRRHVQQTTVRTNMIFINSGAVLEPGTSLVQTDGPGALIAYILSVSRPKLGPELGTWYGY